MPGLEGLMSRSLPILWLLGLLVFPVKTFCEEPHPQQQEGRILVTELMFRPQAANKSGGGVAGTWFELWNPGPEPLPLDQLRVRDAGGRLFQGWPFADAVLAPGAFAVLAQSKEAQNDRPVPADYYFGESLTLDAAEGSLELYLGELLQDRVVWGGEGWPLCPLGYSLSLEPSVTDAAGNDTPEAWCLDTLPNPGLQGGYCDHDGDGFSESQGDCDDHDPTVGPGNFEECNGVDDDCSGHTDDLGELVPPYLCLTSGLCLGTKAVCLGKAGWGCPYPAGFEVDELSCDGADNDCDGFTDEALRNDCGGCFGAPDLCDGVDDDCDGVTDEDEPNPGLVQFCGVEPQGVCAQALPVCGSYGWYCPNIPLYQAEEDLCDALDNDCDGSTDETFEVGAPCTSGEGMCRRAGALECRPDGVGTVCVVEAAAGALELCGNQLDDDCDGGTDEGFSAGQSCTVGVGVCRTTGKWICTQDALGEICSAQPSFPGEELCDNGLDDDCDGYTDEASCTSDPAGSTASCAVGGTLKPPIFLLGLAASLLFAGLRRRARRHH
jgi:hypothetical protein